MIKARSLDAGPKAIQVALVTKDGSAYGKVIEVGTALKAYEIPVADMIKVKTVTMPRPYPTFLPYYFLNNSNVSLKLEDIEGLQISIGSGIPEAKLTGSHGVGLVSLRLE